MRRFYGVVHGIAECQDCGWINQSYKNAQATAAIHARSHHHKVIVELGINCEYDGREDG